MIPTFPRTVASQKAVGTLFNSYTTAKTVINAQALYTFQPNELELGQYIRVTANLAISNIVTSQRTFTFQVMMGAIVVWTSGAITTTTTAHTLIPAKLVVDLRLDSVGPGTTAKFLGMGQLSGQMWVVSGATADIVSTHPTLMVPFTAPAVGTGFDSTIPNSFDFFVGLSANEATTGVQVWEYLVEVLN